MWSARCASCWLDALMGKRAFDLLLSAALLLLLAPLLAGVAAWVKLDSPGPVLFRQQRVGRAGVPFTIHKFRSMRVDAGGLGLTVGEDARITRAGRWLRRTKLDELPQLIDVLAGDMSLVGPRPEVPRYMALYPDEAAELVAASSDSEREYLERILPAKLQVSADYVRRASLWTDLQLVARTALLLLGR